jgi:predicted amidohydrolase
LTERRPLRIAVAQIDTTVGDFEGNCGKIVALGRRAEGGGADVVLFPELAVCGYPPRDLVERPEFVARSERTARSIARASGPAVWIYGSVLPNRKRRGRSVFNAAVAARGGRIMAEYHKRLLPTYDVFDEGRYIEPGLRPATLRVRGRRVAVTICEDIWNDKTFWKRPLYPTDPVAELSAARPDLHVNISASPYSLGKNRLRRRMMERIARRTGVPLVHCNLVGGQRRSRLRRRFDGLRRAWPAGRRVAAIRGGLLDGRPAGRQGSVARGRPRDRRACVARSSSRLSDYARKCGFRARCSGSPAASTPRSPPRSRRRRWGRRACTASRCRARTRREGSLRDAEDLARRLGISFEVVPIAPVLDAYRGSLRRRSAPARRTSRRTSGAHPRRDPHGALEPLRPPRALHGNKSEIAVGYCTLYGTWPGATR